MHRILLSIALLAVSLTAQPRTLRFTHIAERQSLLESATVIRSIGEIRDLHANADDRTLTLSGEPWQLDLAEWLLAKLDRPPLTAPSATERLQLTVSEAPAVRIFYPAKATTVQNLQELATLTRSITEIRRAFTFNASRAVILRGTPQEAEAAEWLFAELDNGPGKHAASPTHQLPGDAEGFIRVFYLRPVLSVEQLQREAAAVRVHTQIRRLFTFNETRAIAVRGTAGQLAEAERYLRDAQLLAVTP